ncbi:MAG: hypothetical protein II577_04695 [Erysipelotrichaceae bacterium]|nr:hypothetical protein [Erysipelotrichaceae bacterium]
MSEKPKSRKRHRVEGTVSEIRKSEEGLGMERVGEVRSFFKKMIRMIRREKDND